MREGGGKGDRCFGVNCGCRATRNSQPHMLRLILSLLLLHLARAGFLSVNMTE